MRAGYWYTRSPRTSQTVLRLSRGRFVVRVRTSAAISW